MRGRQQLSPGTCGILLLLLYLAIDHDRPLIIDPPEENLDPKSIFNAGRTDRANCRRSPIGAAVSKIPISGVWYARFSKGRNRIP
jgi:hypothetical protein